MQERRYGLWQGRKVLFIGDSLTAKRIYPEVVKDILGIETFYHCKGGASLKSMVDGDNGIGGDVFFCYFCDPFVLYEHVDMLISVSEIVRKSYILN